jgi:hypothetical protein
VAQVANQVVDGGRAARIATFFASLFQAAEVAQCLSRCLGGVGACVATLARFHFQMEA